MLTEDYIIRMINLAIAALLRISGLKKSGQHEDALQLIDLTFEQFLGLRASMAKSLDDGRLYYLLTRNDRLDTRRLQIIADLFKEEGDVYAALNRGEESRADYARALKYYLDLYLNSPDEIDPVEMIQKIEGLLSLLDLQSLPADTLWPLSGYYEDAGAFAKAEAVFLVLAARPETQAAIQPELAAFYARLAEKSPAELEKGGLSAAHVRARLSGGDPQTL